MLEAAGKVAIKTKHLEVSISGYTDNVKHRDPPREPHVVVLSLLAACLTDTLCAKCLARASFPCHPTSLTGQDQTHHL